MYMIMSVQYSDYSIFSLPITSTTIRVFEFTRANSYCLKLVETSKHPS